MAARVNRGRTRRLTGPHKVALLLRLLDEEVSKAILTHLGDRDIARIHRADTDLGTVDEDLLRQVAVDFKERVGHGDGGIAGATTRRLDGLIRNTFEEDRLENIFGRTDADIGKIQDTLADIDARVIGRILSREYPQTCALVISQLPSEQAAGVVLALPDELRTDVVMRIARMEKISEDMLAELNRALERELAGFEGAAQAQEMEGVDVAVQIFMNMDRASEQALLESIADEDADVGTLIREQMFIFDDLLGIDDRGIQALLRNIENQTLTLALKGADDEMLQKFLSNVSKRVATSLREDLDTMGPVRLSEVEGAQQKIANAAREMVERGEIVVAGRGEDELV
jgi:flagellar motor switch protein FliG